MTCVYVFSVMSTVECPISSAITLLGTPRSCDQEETDAAASRPSGANRHSEGRAPIDQ